MKRSGLVVTVIGLAIALIPAAYYTGVNFEAFEPDVTAYKIFNVLDLIAKVLVLIGVIVVLAGWRRGTEPGSPVAGYPPPGFAPPGYPPQPGYPPPTGQSPPYGTSRPDLSK